MGVFSVFAIHLTHPLQPQLTQTHKMCPTGRIFRVRRHHHPTLHDEHPNCAHMGTIWVFVILSSRQRPKHANGGMFGSLLSTLRTPSSPGSHEHTKHVLQDAFFVFDATTTPHFTSN